jgi:hypothetical protein
MQELSSTRSRVMRASQDSNLASLYDGIFFAWSNAPDLATDTPPAQASDRGCLPASRAQRQSTPASSMAVTDAGMDGDLVQQMCRGAERTPLGELAQQHPNEFAVRRQSSQGFEEFASYPVQVDPWLDAPRRATSTTDPLRAMSVSW